MDEPRSFMLEAYEQAKSSMEGAIKEAGEKALEEAYAPNKVEKQMDDLEELTKLFYETCMQSKYQRASEILPWDAQPEFWKKDYRAGVKAVVERVFEKQRLAVEASE